MLSKLTSLNAMQIEISLLQHKISISTRSMFPAPAPPCPADFEPFPAQPRTVGRGVVPRPAVPHRFLALPLPAPPREKNSFPVHPWNQPCHLPSYWITLPHDLENLSNLLVSKSSTTSPHHLQLIAPLGRDHSLSGRRLDTRFIASTSTILPNIFSVK